MKRKIHYGWVVLACCILVAFVVTGICNNTKGMYLQPVSDGLGVTRSSLSIVTMFSALIAAGCSLFIGALRKRFSLRQLVVYGSALLVVGDFIYAFAPNLAIYFIGETIFGFGLGFCSVTVTSLLIRAWFAKNLGTILGALYMATGVGSVFCAPMIGQLIAKWDYRTSYIVVGVILIVLFVISALFVRDDPAEMGLEPLWSNKLDASDKKTAQADGYTLKQAFRMPQFYLMCAMGFMVGFGLNAVQGTYNAFISADKGFGTVFAASIVSLLYVFNSVAKIPLGRMIDKIGVRPVMMICIVSMLCAAVSLTMLEDQAYIAYIFAAFWGIGNIAFTVPVPIIPPTIFGTKDVAALTGIFMGILQLGSAIAMPVANFIYDMVGSYVPLYTAMIVVFVIAAVINLIIVRPVRK